MYHLVRAAAFVRVLDHAQVQIPTFPKPKLPTFLERPEGIYPLNRHLCFGNKSFYGGSCLLKAIRSEFAEMSLNG